ncbi:MAG: cyclic nucleotide-binding domain-containing protein [Candidatus Edwardsbacteria bacterium]|nr:cyclic nucleotide-binding domain-containing protein [Candidatus Edwardsbacteria bacterium]
MWGLLGAKLDFSQARPEALPGFEEARFVDVDGRGYYVLKAPGAAGYVKLGENDRYLFSLLDGRRTVQQVLVEYFRRYGALAFSRVGSLVSQLSAGGFLTRRPVGFYARLLRKLALQKPLARALDLLRALPQRQWPVPGFDRLVGTLYRRGFWLFFTPAVIAPTSLLALAGLAAFVAVLRTGRYSVLTSSGSYLLGLAVLVALNYLAVITHELSHALACKRFRRSVNSGGTILRWGFPAFYVDTTDTWLLPRRQRMLVTMVGPYTQFFLAGVAALLAWWGPLAALNPLLYKFAALSYLSVFLNLNPLLPLDGYYMLADWLEIPGLRDKATRFVRRELFAKLRAQAPLSKNEKIYAWFGLAVFAWSVLALAAAVALYREQAVAAVRWFFQATSPGQRLALAGLLAAALLGSVAGARRRVAGLLAAAWRALLRFVNGHVAAAGSGLAGVALAAAWLVSLSRGWPHLLLTGLALAGGVALFWRVNAYYRGSHLSLTLASLLAGAVVCLIVPELPSTAQTYALLAGSTAAFLAGYGQFSFSSLRRWRAWQRWLWGPLWYGSLLVIGLTSRGHLHQSLALLIAAASSLMALSLIWNNRGSALQYFWIIFLLGSLGWGLFVIDPAAALFATAAGLLELAALLWLFLVIKGTSWSPGTSAFEPAASERRRMRQAAVKIYRTARAYYTTFFGVAAARAMDDRLNLILIERGWPIRLYGDRSEERFERGAGIVDRARAFAGMLDAMRDYLGAEGGEYFAGNALKTAYESLYWEEREIAQQNLMPGARWPAGLALARAGRERREARDAVDGVARFWELSDAERQALSSRLKEERRAAGAVIIRQGDAGDKFYLVKSGAVEVVIRMPDGAEHVAARLSAGDYFGEIALVKNVPRTATVRAVADCSLLTLDRGDFALLLSQQVDLAPRIDRLIENRAFLSRLPLFAEFAPGQMAMVASRLVPERYRAGQRIFSQGDPGDSFYIVKEGQVDILVARDGQQSRVAELGPGEYFGEIALLLDVPRTAGVVARSDCLVLRLMQGDFMELLGEQLYFSKSLEQASSRRMKDTRYKINVE